MTLSTARYCHHEDFPRDEELSRLYDVFSSMSLISRISPPSFQEKDRHRVAFAKQGRGLIKVNGQPIENIEPECLRLKAFEPVLILGQDKFANLDIRIRVKGGGYTAQIYAIRSAIAKSIVAYYAKYVDESAKNELRATLLAYDRNLLVADPRRREPKKYGGRGARARFQKSYR
eukprot:CAMPEP_0201657858 /NCGR_PEP_ID=MMETSP0494-20130426/954_1 /ASSEMBLY_ACC=CAM_ASM_000839 /TAXON_ID=420259 /ORGANISM="Thalassiosira gravida, Strain GMp14c1" /LENGTH=173 /DNA_ID=CAMNT_0048134765 /DNA_START=171 /DNA_END=693 /DNA_ORIENTATION=-